MDYLDLVIDFSLSSASQLTSSLIAFPFFHPILSPQTTFNATTMSVSILSRAYTKHSKFVPAPRFTTPTALPISDNSSTVFNEVLDDQRAQREKMLKIRFARTIKRAKTFLKGGSSDLEEKERAVSLKPQKKATTESHSRIQLEKRRKAARMALEEMEKTVVVDDNFKVMKELKILLGDNGGNSRKLMGVLGLHLKKVEEEEE